MNWRDEGVRTLRAPLTEEQFRPLAPECDVVQFDSAMNADELRRIALLLSEYPDAWLRVYGYETYPNLDFLHAFSAVRRVAVDIWRLQDISGLSQLRPDLIALNLGGTKRRFSLSFLDRFTNLDTLDLERHVKDHEVIASLTTIRRLALRSITLPDLSITRPLRRLEKFELRLGGTTDLAGLEHVPNLKYLEIWMVRGLSDLQFIGRLKSLQFLFLQTLKHVTRLPSLGALTKLRRVRLLTMRGLANVSPIADAPALEEVELLDMPQLRIDSARAFANHRTLRAARFFTGSTKRNAELAGVLGLPDDVGRFEFRD